MLAMTGIITCRTDKHSFLTLFQDTEYLHGQLFERSTESACGSVSCLPGALTLLRFSAFRNVVRFYFSDKAEQCEDIFDYAKQILGEDRWLTHLFMLGARKRCQIQLSTSAFCKTEAVQTFRSLLKQRRRWFLGFITNEVCMLTDARLWKKYPFLLLLRFITLTVRTTTLQLLITLIAVATTSESPIILPWEFMLMSMGLGWLMMFYFAFKLHRWKALLYPFMWSVSPFLNWIFMVYGLFTAGQRTWGGPRADAGAADSQITAQQAIEQARGADDDLNVVPETFRPAAETRKRYTRPSALQPSASVEGRFSGRGYEHRSLDMSDTMSVHTPKVV
jgi:chitin synthase